jgi:hypothetical protein
MLVRGSVLRQALMERGMVMVSESQTETARFSIHERETMLQRLPNGLSGARLFFAGALVALLPLLACANPLTGLTYTYDLSMADPGTGIFTTPHADADDTVDATDLAAVTSSGLLTDGDLGSLIAVPTAVFPNGTYAGFRNEGFGGTTQPRVNLDLGGTYFVDTLQLHYLVEDPSSIYAPQPIPDGSGGFLYDALSVAGSTDGENFTVLGSVNDFVPVFGLNGDFGSGLTEVRTAMVSLGGVTATHLQMDVHTPWTFIFLSEIVVDGTPAAVASADFDVDVDVDGGDFLIWQRGFGHGITRGEGDANATQTVDGADLVIWEGQFGEHSGRAIVVSVPEPAACAMLAAWGCCVVAAGRGVVRGRRSGWLLLHLN